MNIPVWQPLHPQESRMWQLMKIIERKYQISMDNYQQFHTWSIAHPELFWEEVRLYFQLEFTTPATQVLNQYQHMLDARWFEGATFNFAQQLLKRDDQHPAIVSIDEHGHREEISYHELRARVASCAAGLKKAGVQAGDRVAAIMPNVAYTVIAMLATTSLGAVWSSCSPDFGAQAALDRLGQIDPKILFTCDGHQYLGKQHDAFDKIQEVSAGMASLEKIVVCPVINSPSDFKKINKALWWNEFIVPGTVCEFVPMPFAHPAYILFSSGTTGKPKCIVHTAGGTYLQHLKELGLHSNLGEHDKLFFYTTCGWMMWNWMVSVLALGATLVLYEGAPTYPDAYRLFDLLEQENITAFGTSPKFLSSVEKAGVIPKERYSFPYLKTILSTGSPLLPKNYDYVYQQVKSDVQLSSISGGTDIISCFALGNPISPVYRGELQCLGLGLAVEVYDQQGQSIREDCGELVCTKPFPSMPLSFWGDVDKQKYKASYFERFENVWAHGDFAQITEHDGLIINGRSDTVLNPGGVRIGTAEIYRQVEKIHEIEESVVIGQKWQDDVRVVLFVKLMPGKILNEELQSLIRKTIRTNASPRHVPAKILAVQDIPHTISGKVVEVAVRQTVHGYPVNNLNSIANPEALEYFKDREELKDSEQDNP